MTTSMTVFVCDDAAKAATAQQFLISSGYPAGAVTMEAVTNFTYDATTYDGGKNDSLLNKIVVIGRIP
jgi:hypothetical protein